MHSPLTNQTILFQVENLFKLKYRFLNDVLVDIIKQFYMLNCIIKNIFI
jgi:hypothetical protein